MLNASRYSSFVSDMTVIEKIEETKKTFEQTVRVA